MAACVMAPIAVVLKDLIRYSSESEPAVSYSNGTRYVVLQRLPAGIRFFAADHGADMDVGYFPSLHDAASFVRQWLLGLPLSSIAAPRTHRRNRKKRESFGELSSHSIRCRWRVRFSAL